MSLIAKGAACLAALGIRASARPANSTPGFPFPEPPGARGAAFAPPMPSDQHEAFLHEPAFSRQSSALGKQTAEIKVCCDDNLKTWVNLHAAKFGMSSSEYVRNLLWKERGGYTYDDAVEELERHSRQLRAQAFAAPLPIEGGNGADVTPVATLVRKGQL